MIPSRPYHQTSKQTHLNMSIESGITYIVSLFLQTNTQK
jgi:hypothetical protein